MTLDYLAIALTAGIILKEVKPAMRGNTFAVISTVLCVHRKFPQCTVKPVLPSNESYGICIYIYRKREVERPRESDGEPW